MKKVFYGVIIVLMSVSVAQADTINYSGRDWTTTSYAHRDDVAVLTQYVVNDSDSATMTGVYGYDGQASMTTSLTLNVGDVVSYDWYITKEMRDPIGDGETDWIGSADSQFLDASDNTLAQAHLDNNAHTWMDLGGWQSGDFSAGIHFEWAVTSATTIEATATALASGTDYTATYTIGDVSDIASFRLALWDSEQDVTVENFSVVPEPATLSLLALGGLLLRKRK